MYFKGRKSIYFFLSKYLLTSSRPRHMCTEVAEFPSAESQINRDTFLELANTDLTHINFSSSGICKKEMEIIRPL